jgi:NADPH:quinone reductase-like Zn-dependent oxidoreductase
VNSANGGVGQALLDLLRAYGISAIGAAARARHDIVASYGAIPIEGRLAPLSAGVHAVRVEGADAAPSRIWRAWSRKASDFMCLAAGI